MITHPIETAPHDRQILVYGPCRWESLDTKAAPDWRVAEWNDALTYDEDCKPMGGWQSVTANPYKDWIVATCWAELPSPTA